jgi:hypothetical protein
MDSLIHELHETSATFAEILHNDDKNWSMEKWLAVFFFFFFGVVGGGVQLGPLGTAATNRPIVPAPGNYDDGEIGGTKSVPVVKISSDSQP